MGEILKKKKKNRGAYKFGVWVDVWMGGGD